MDELSMIEGAARAAGLATRRHRVRDLEAVHVRAEGASEWRYFNPLKSDADTNELIAAARIDVMHFQDYVDAHAGKATCRVAAFDQIDVDQMPDSDGADRRRAMRRAVTECAARIATSIGQRWWR